MNFYIGTSLSNVEQHNVLRDQLVELGHEITHDWTHLGSVQEQKEQWSVVAVHDTEGVLGADFTVILLPGGRGTHTELGLALAKACLFGEPLIVWAPDEPTLLGGVGYTSVFYHHPSVVLLIGDFDKLAASIARVLADRALEDETLNDILDDDYDSEEELDLRPKCVCGARTLEPSGDHGRACKLFRMS